MFKLVIASAGVGSRSGCTVNKALTTIGDKPMIAHVVDAFPNAAEVIVVLGYQGDYVRQALEAIYGCARIKFITVDDHTTGLGHTLLAARDELRCPFVFSPNDTLIEPCGTERDPSVVGNWMGYHTVRSGPLDITQYRTVSIADGFITGINPKGHTENNCIYTGVAGVQDHEKFWSTMNDPAALEAGESHGLKALSNVRAFEIAEWRDGGSALSLAHVKRDTRSRYNILEKPNEAIWFTDDRVIKFATDERFIANRVQRMKYIDPELLPRLLSTKPNLYAYHRVEGVTLSGVITEDIFDRLFATMEQRVWRATRFWRTSIGEHHRDYWSFYRDKTLARVGLFLDRDECVDQAERINGVATPALGEILLRSVDWYNLCHKPCVSHYHGDFHNENILLRPDGSFTLLDWRQDFEGDLEYGDVYYDLAKFAHGLIVSHDAVAHDEYRVTRLVGGDVKVDVHRPDNLARVEARFEAWLAANRFDRRRVRLLTALIFLNICGLHHYPYSMFLYYLGKKMLTEAVLEHSYR